MTVQNGSVGFQGGILSIFKDDPIDFKRTRTRFGNSTNFYLLMNNSGLLMILKILQEKGNLLSEPYSNHLDDGIFEIRGKVGSDISRVLYFFYFGGKIIVTNGFIKKTQKTPSKEIEKAKCYRKDYLERFGE